MIARQRQVYRNTFSANELKQTSTSTLERLAKYQSEIREATAELAAGVLEFSETDPLSDATNAMDSAVAALRQADFGNAINAEETALASLIRARENMRKMLAQSNSAAASQCRTFDRQQRQKLRKPEDIKKEQDQQVAELRSKLDEMAEQQRKWSEDLRQASPANAQSEAKATRADSPPDSQATAKSKPASSSSQSSSSSNAPSESRQRAGMQQDMAKQQAAHLQAAKQLEQQLADSAKSSELATKAMETAAEAIQDSLDRLADKQLGDAAESADAAANRMDDVERHLAALNAGDFGQRLARAHQAARQLADSQHALASKARHQQRDVSDESQGGSRGGTGDPGELKDRQLWLADQTDMLAELLARLQADAFEQKQTVRSQLDSVNANSPPSIIAGTMRDAAEDLAGKNRDRGAESAALAAEDLDRLSDRLEKARASFSQPSLEELVALEQQVADLMAELQHADSGAAVAKSRDRVDRLDQQLRSIAPGDTRLAAAAESLRSPSSNGRAKPSGAASNHSTTAATPRENGWNQSGRVLTDRLRVVGKALQKRIQEVILAGALKDADQDVPPEFSDLVDEYYRTLSDDLRP